MHATCVGLYLGHPQARLLSNLYFLSDVHNNPQPVPTLNIFKPVHYFPFSKAHFNYPPIYVCVFKVVSFHRISTPKANTQFSSPIRVPKSSRTTLVLWFCSIERNVYISRQTRCTNSYNESLLIIIRMCASSWSVYIHIAIWCTVHTTSY